MRALVGGYGSIGVRHARLLAELGCHTAVVSRRKVDFPVAYLGLAEALENEHPDYIVIANATNQHHNTLSALSLLGYTGTVLVEKPLFSNWQEISPQPIQKVFVAYNLRFHPIIQRSRRYWRREDIIRASLRRAISTGLEANV